MEQLKHFYCHCGATGAGSGSCAFPGVQGHCHVRPAPESAGGSGQQPAALRLGGHIRHAGRLRRDRQWGPGSAARGAPCARRAEPPAPLQPGTHRGERRPGAALGGSVGGGAAGGRGAAEPGEQPRGSAHRVEARPARRPVPRLGGAQEPEAEQPQRQHRPHGAGTAGRGRRRRLYSRAREPPRPALRRRPRSRPRYRAALPAGAAPGTAAPAPEHRSRQDSAHGRGERGRTVTGGGAAGPGAPVPSLLELPLLAAHGAVLLHRLRVEPLEDAVHVEAVRALPPHQRAVVPGHLACGRPRVSGTAGPPHPRSPGHSQPGRHRRSPAHPVTRSRGSTR